jgi:hypothetical protein
MTDAAEVHRLGKVLLLSASPDTRAWAARALGDRGQLCAYAWLRRALWDPDEEVRLSAVESISRLSVSQSAPELAAAYAWSGPRLRRGIVAAARRMDRAGAFGDILRMAAEDPDPRVRSLALRARAGTGRGRT